MLLKYNYHRFKSSENFASFYVIYFLPDLSAPRATDLLRLCLIYIAVLVQGLRVEYLTPSLYLPPFFLHTRMSGGLKKPC